jgi:biopolymer transport protein ExbD
MTGSRQGWSASPPQSAMIRPKHPRPAPSDESAAPDTSSLIDVAFLLLVYFLATSTLEPREGDLSLATGGRLGSSVGIDRPLIQVDAEGRVSMGEELLETDPGQRELPRLADRLRTYLEAHAILASSAAPAVELDVSDAVPGQRFVDVVNCLAGVGITNIAIHGPTDPADR